MHFKLIIFIISGFFQAHSYSDADKNRMLEQIWHAGHKTRSVHPMESAKEMMDNDCDHGICEKSLNYPEDTIIELIKENKNVHSFFGKVIEPDQLFNEFFSNRIGFEGRKSEPFCKSRMVTKVPKELPDLNGQKRLIANVGELYQQAISFEVCMNRGDACAITGQLALSYATACEQRYSVIKLLTFNTAERKLSYERFSIPSTCVCTYVKPGNQ